jgi:uracil-DNA glycosylase family 4
MSSSCTDCPLYQSASTVCVPGTRIGGPSDILVVGDAPGLQEDAEGRLGIGAAAELLRHELSRVGITDYQYTNVVRCYAGGAPKPKFVKACRHYLEDEIDEIQPRYVLALGATAWKEFGEGNVTDAAGREIQRGGRTVMPTLHPAAIIRDPNKGAAWRADLARFGHLVRGGLLAQPPVTVRLVRTPAQVENLIAQLNAADIITFDFEALPFPSIEGERQPWKKIVPQDHKGYLPLSVSFCLSAGGASVLPLWHKESALTEETLKSFFVRVRKAMTMKKVTAHNMLYDDLAWEATCRRLEIEPYMPRVTFDTMVAAHILDENRPKSLKWLGRALLGWPNWDIDAGKEHPLHELAYYNGADAAATYLLRQRLLADLSDHPRLRRYFSTLEMPKLRALERVISRGVYVEMDTVRGHIARAGERMESAKAEVQRVSGGAVENPGSTQQLGRWLFGTLGLTPVKLTPEGSPSTDEESIKRLALKRPEVQTVLEYRKWQKYHGTYLTPLLSRVSVSYDARLHPEYRSTSVETGRLASPFHTTPRDPFVRSLYTAPPGFSLVQSDMSQIEARLAAWETLGRPATMSGVSPTSMLAAWMAGIDVYCETAGSVLEKDPALVDRDKSNPHNERQILGKVPTLSMLYNISPKGLKSYVWREFEIDWTDAFAQQVWRAFHRRWPEFAVWHARVSSLIRACGDVTSALGRVRRLPGAVGGGEKAVHDAINSGINAPVQSLASDLTQASMILLDRLGLKIIGNVHDALLFEVADSDLQTVLPLIKTTMETSHRELRTLGLYLPEGLVKVEITVGNWGEGKEWKL